VSAIARLVRADYLERVRRHSFLVTLGFVLYAAYLFMPANHTSVATLNLDGHRGVYNSAWVGALIAMLSATFLSFAGFFLVRDAIGRDRRTGVGPVLAATPLRSATYLFAKFLSNLCVLGSMVLVLIAAAAAMQLIRGEDTHVRLVTLAAPFVVIALPAVALVAGVAIVFEVVPLLRGGFGNIVYFFLWLFTVSLSTAVTGGMAHDPLGTFVCLPQMREACAAAFPGYDAVHGPLAMGFNIKEQGVWNLRTFTWEGMRWSAGAVAGRLAWMIGAATIATGSAIVFDRFDTPAAAPRRKRGKPKRGAPADEPDDAAPAVEEARATAHLAGHRMTAAAVADARPRARFASLVIAELRLALQGVTRWWWLVAIGLAVACAFVPLAVMQRFLLPFAMVWPLLRWSPLGSRESLNRTDGLLFSTPRPLLRLLAAQWTMGLVIAVAIAAGALIRYLIAGDLAAAGGLLAGLAFIPSLALACGAWTGNARLFEVLYMVLWYGGPIEGVPPLDFAHPSPVVAVRLVVATAVLLALAVAARRRKLGA
jgi:hypothetical protein